MIVKAKAIACDGLAVGTALGLGWGVIVASRHATLRSRIAIIEILVQVGTIAQAATIESSQPKLAGRICTVLSGIYAAALFVRFQDGVQKLNEVRAKWDIRSFCEVAYTFTSLTGYNLPRLINDYGKRVWYLRYSHSDTARSSLPTLPSEEEIKSCAPSNIENLLDRCKLVLHAPLQERIKAKGSVHAAELWKNQAEETYFQVLASKSIVNAGKQLQEKGIETLLALWSLFNDKKEILHCYNSVVELADALGSCLSLIPKVYDDTFVGAGQLRAPGGVWYWGTRVGMLGLKTGQIAATIVWSPKASILGASIGLLYPRRPLNDLIEDSDRFARKNRLEQLRTLNTESMLFSKIMNFPRLGGFLSGQRIGATIRCWIGYSFQGIRAI